MTTSELTYPREWATNPLGKTVRIGIAVAGLATSAVVLLLATLTSSAVWFIVLLGVSLAASSIRAALHPSVTRLATVTAVIVTIPIVLRLL